MTPKIELRFVRQKVYMDKTDINDEDAFILHRILQFRYVYEQTSKYTNATEWKTVTFDESVVLEPEETSASKITMKDIEASANEYAQQAYEDTE